MTSKGGWIGVDFDGTLAEYPGSFGVPHGIGKPIPRMVERVQSWIKEGQEVRIVTARAAGPFVDTAGQNVGYDAAIKEVQDWCLEHIGTVLSVTCQKDYSMIELWDDRAVQVIPNTGRTVQEDLDKCMEALDISFKQYRDMAGFAKNMVVNG